MKIKIFAVLLCAVTVFALSGCGKEDKITDSSVQSKVTDAPAADVSADTENEPETDDAGSDRDNETAPSPDGSEGGMSVGDVTPETSEGKSDGKTPGGEKKQDDGKKPDDSTPDTEVGQPVETSGETSDGGNSPHNTEGGFGPIFIPGSKL